MNQVADFVDLSGEEYGVKYGGTKGNVTLMSFDGQYKLQRAVGEHRVFDERIQAAKAKIDVCIQRWSEGSSDQIKALVDHAFRVNKQGHIDVNQVLSLRQLDISDSDWIEANTWSKSVGRRPPTHNSPNAWSRTACRNVARLCFKISSRCATNSSRVRGRVVHRRA